ncbi:MAG TPA: cob(I)yrinic acid a,c-diamide adenosyltransferase [Gemmataceae bacterium]
MVYLSRIYTRTGDAGQTSLGDGGRRPKDDPRVEAYGQVDELNAVLGLALAAAPDMPEAGLLKGIQNDLFDLGADLCVPPSDAPKPGPELRVVPGQVVRLEEAIDRLNAGLPPLKSFVLPGGSAAAGWLHLARTVCRRAERAVVTLMRGEKVNPQVLVYLNRLSDLLFVLARVANRGGGGDVLWVPGQSRGPAEAGQAGEGGAGE